MLLSRFGRFNPIYRFPSANAGLATTFQFNDQIALQLSYMAGEAENACSRSRIIQRQLRSDRSIGHTLLSSRLTLGFTYANAYTQARDSTGGNAIGNNIGAGSSRSRVAIGRPLSINSYGVEANFKSFQQAS